MTEDKTTTIDYPGLGTVEAVEEEGTTTISEHYYKPDEGMETVAQYLENLAKEVRAKKVEGILLAFCKAGDETKEVEQEDGTKAIAKRMEINGGWFGNPFVLPFAIPGLTDCLKQAIEKGMEVVYRRTMSN